MMRYYATMIIAALLSCLASLVVADNGKRAVILDVDGTLTPNVYAVSIARNDAAGAVQAYADAGIEIIYLTARVPLFQAGIEDWLVENGFPSGRLHLTETEDDRDNHGAFKARILANYAADGWSFVAAFGDSQSDFAAYAAAGIPQEHVFALRRSGAWDCKPGIWQGCYDDWADLIPTITASLAN